MSNPLRQITAWIRDRLSRRRNSSALSTDTAGQAERQLVTSLAKSRVPTVRQLRYLPKILSRNELFLLRALTGFVVVAMFFLGARAYARNVVQLPRSGGESTEALIGTPQYLNPLLSSSDIDRDLVRILYAGLMKRNERQELEPDLAERYEVSDDKKTYTVYLKKKLYWSDGQPLNADDVLLTLDLILDPLYKSPSRSLFRNVKVERLDDTAITFTLPQPSASFLTNLTIGILPAHIWGDVPPTSFPLIEFNVKPVGSGPFMFDTLRRDSVTGAVKEYQLIRNNRYHGDRPFLDRLTFKIYPDQESAAAGLRSKATEGISVVTRDMLKELRQVRTVELQISQYFAVYFNAKRPVVKTLEVRKALAQAVDRDRIIRDVLRRMATITDGPIPPNFPGFAGKLQPDYNPESARAALEAAGWRTAGDGLRKKGADELKLSLSVVDQPEDRAIAAIVKENWEAVGAKVEIKSYDPTRIPKDVIKPRDYDALLYGEIFSPDMDLYPFWHSSQEQDPGLNLTRFFNKDADKLLEELRTTSDPAVQVDKRIAFQRLQAEQTQVIFLFSPTYSYGLPKRVKGFTEKTLFLPADRFAGIEHWYVKTRASLKKN
ncbi:MAG: hypothetical protein HY420_00405 [Candidatus Kerfeldbacteria bacterium]|nr:hypothetical protein [Candidatus Kerfeldbacteria bacterium]